MKLAAPSPGHSETIRIRREALRRQCEAIFSEATTCVWEVGCGHGHFLTAFARAHPKLVCVGIDRTLERIERAERKRDRAGLERLHFLRADAGDFLAVLPAPIRFSAIYILFPDPWPKRRHHKNRLVSPAFLARVAERTDPDGRLYLRTDYEAYFRRAEADLAAASGWRRADEPWPFEFATVFQDRAGSYFSLVAARDSTR